MTESTPPTLLREQVRELDRRAIEEFGVPGMVLMENAGRGVADLLCRLGIAGRVVICCGKGNNGGDGLVVARHLQLRGFAFQLWTWSDLSQWQGDAAANLKICQAAGMRLEQGNARQSSIGEFVAAVASADWVVDALLGTGAQGAPRSPLDKVIKIMNGSPAKKLAIDVPSGLDCDTGEVVGAVFQADHTCTFVAAKPGLLMSKSLRTHDAVGELHIVDIGAPKCLVDEMLGLHPGEPAA